jgi:broad specificity phosphatase PhoE
MRQRRLRSQVWVAPFLALAPTATKPNVAAFSRGSSLPTSTLQAQKSTDIVFVRHGCTYMNEYLGQGPSFGAPYFTDVFRDAPARDRYHDTPLSERGWRQVRQLQTDQPDFVHDVDLVVVSPLRRALQTFHLGLSEWVGQQSPALASARTHPSTPRRHVPIIAHPAAAERLYLVSDVGRPVSLLRQDYPYIDFDTHFTDDPQWWWRHNPVGDGPYQEWRPTGQGQAYACWSEPQHAFDARMHHLYAFLRTQVAGGKYRTIAVVCHHGVIDWMLGQDFDNCQWRRVPWQEIQPAALSIPTTTVRNAPK